MDRQSWFAAVRSNNVEEVKKLISSGAELNARNEEGQTALHLAVLNGTFSDADAPLVSELLSAGADKNAKQQNSGWTPLHLAIANNHVAAVSALLAHRVQTEVWDDRGKAPLHLAARQGHTQIVKELLSSGADKNARERIAGATPLHIAAFEGLPWIVKILLEAGADKGAKNKYGSTALDLAKEGRISLASQKGYTDPPEKRYATVIELLTTSNEKKQVSFLKRLFGGRSQSDVGRGRLDN